MTGLDNHPLRKYLAEGIRCVQGTDGAALYGTCSIDEQLSLQKLLGLTDAEMQAMKDAETGLILASEEAYSNKKEVFRRILGNQSMEDFFLDRMDEDQVAKSIKLPVKRLDANTELKDQIQDLPWDRTPVIVMGGSFNSEKRATRMTKEGQKQLDALLNALNPDETFFVIGHKLRGYEKYLVDHNEKGFRIFAFVPSRLARKEVTALKDSGVFIRVSTESEGMGIYKSFNYEIFERRPSILVGFDGNSAGGNMLQEAKNGKGSARIFVWEKCTALREKAASLRGYVGIFDAGHPLASEIMAGGRD
jgi:hypothetical protein